MIPVRVQLRDATELVPVRIIAGGAVACAAQARLTDRAMRKAYDRAARQARAAASEATTRVYRRDPTRERSP